jgi:F-type H+-transporting ATPase subunit alpha
MTAFPIVETTEGEIAAYIPTNLISITDGQVYLDRDLFAGGFRPAIDIARSVSRIGGAAQHPRIKAEAGRMKLDYLQFLELEVFTRFGARLEASMEAAIRAANVLRDILEAGPARPGTGPLPARLADRFNDGLFVDINEDRLPELLHSLRQQVDGSSLTLDSPREEWSNAVAGWIRADAGEAAS